MLFVLLLFVYATPLFLTSSISWAPSQRISYTVNVPDSLVPIDAKKEQVVGYLDDVIASVISDLQQSLPSFIKFEDYFSTSLVDVALGKAMNALLFLKRTTKVTFQHYQALALPLKDHIIFPFLDILDSKVISKLELIEYQTGQIMIYFLKLTNKYPHILKQQIHPWPLESSLDKIPGNLVRVVNKKTL